ncbi:hypothetical protein K8Q96_00440 [Candidatus Nomurabacteria bacterium]|nr:hypothetical protein [Candidatus Nomurabacteria bacterium]
MGIKYKVNESFFEKWSPNMAYVLGYIYADGSLNDSPYMRGKYIQITSIDEDSIQRIKGWLNSEHKIIKKKSNFTGGKICFVLRIVSHKIYNDLFKLGLYPNKSLTINFPKVPKKYLGHFIRGYFDGDGCIYFEKSKGKMNQLIIKRIRTIFTSGSKKFLENMSIFLQTKGLRNGKIYYNKRAFQLKYPTSDSIKIFKLIYKGTSINSFFMRKFNIFKDYFELRPQVVDLTIRRILADHVVK